MPLDLANFTKRGRGIIWAQTCTIKRATGDASLYGTPVTVHSDLNCSRVYEMSDEEREKWFLTTVSRPLVIYTDKPSSGNIREQDIVVVNGENYTVMKANRWPHSSPAFYELLVEYKRGL